MDIFLDIALLLGGAAFGFLIASLLSVSGKTDAAEQAYGQGFQDGRRYAEAATASLTRDRVGEAS